jgi:hypothetical protein
MTYATPDATWLAERVRRLMPDTEPVHVHASRGLDHGAWVPLKVMEPGADVPVLQLSMPTHDPDRLLRLGARLRPLRDEGVLIIGSGYMTHGLPHLSFEHMALNHVPGWSREFDAWAAEQLARGSRRRAVGLRSRPACPRASDGRALHAAVRRARCGVRSVLRSADRHRRLPDGTREALARVRLSVGGSLPGRRATPDDAPSESDVFDALQERLSGALDGLRGRGRLDAARSTRR